MHLILNYEWIHQKGLLAGQKGYSFFNEILDAPEIKTTEELKNYLKTLVSERPADGAIEIAKIHSDTTERNIEKMAEELTGKVIKIDDEEVFFATPGTDSEQTINPSFKVDIKLLV